MIRTLVHLAGGLMLLLPALAALADEKATTDAASTCAIPAEMLPDEPVAPLALARLAGDEPVTVVALGGASTAGHAAGGGEHAWPARLAAALATRYPSASIVVHNRGVAQESAQDMAARIERDVLPEKPVLVIWETGTVDAARGLDVDDFREALQEGIDRLQAGGADVVLMDMQFSRFTEMLISLERYAAEMRDAASTRGIGIFPRRELMRHWAEAGLFDDGFQYPASQTALARWLYDCLGRTLAEFLTHDATVPAEAVKR